MSKYQTKKIIDAGDVSEEIFSAVVNLQNNYGFAVQVSFDGSPSGVVVIQGSNDQENWSVIDTLSIFGNSLLSSNKDAIYWPFIRVYKDDGGTGTMTVTITVKGA